MRFLSSALALGQEITEAVNLIRGWVQPSAWPPVLYHGTDFHGVKGIIRTHALWGTCVNDLADKTEIEHGVEIIKDKIKRRRFSAQETISERLLELVPEFLQERKSWTFVACFRGALRDAP